MPENSVVSPFVENQNGNGAWINKPEICGLPMTGLGGFREWLLNLESCEECLRLEAKTPLEIDTYKTALFRWKEAGYPYPGEWPDTEFRPEGLRVSSYTRKWMLKWSESGKQDFLFSIPKNLINLWDMETYQARRLVNISEWLASCRLATLHPEVLTTEANAKILGFLEKIATEAQAINLTQTAILARRVLSEFDGQNISQMFDRINFLADLFGQESMSIHFFTVKEGRFRYYNNSELAGEQFKVSFPKGNVELIEAGNCLVTDRYTACVFHLMRALEIALVSLERDLGIPRPAQGPDKTWGRTLARIKDKIAQNDKIPVAKWSSEREFYEKAHAFLAAVKNPLRDDTIHVETTYDEQSAIGIFNVTIEAFRFLATKLSESNGGVITALST
jgi:hypothetical protein